MDTLRRDGPGAFLAKAGDKIASAICRTNSADWYRADLSDDPPPIPLPADSIVDFNATRQVFDWLDELQEWFKWVRSEPELAAARRCDHLYVLLHVEGRRAGYVKVGFVSAYVTDFAREVAIPPRVAFIYDTFVHPDFRGRRLAGAMIDRTMEHLKAGDFRAVWCHIPRWNQASIRTFLHCDFHSVGHIRYWRILGHGFCTRSPEKMLAR